MRNHEGFWDEGWHNPICAFKNSAYLLCAEEQVGGKGQMKPRDQFGNHYSNSDAKWGAADLRWNLRELCNWEDSLVSKWRILGKDLCLCERCQGKSTMSDLGSWLTEESVLCWDDQESCFDYVRGSSRREKNNRNDKKCYVLCQTSFWN